VLLSFPLPPSPCLPVPARYRYAGIRSVQRTQHGGEASSLCLTASCKTVEPNSHIRFSSAHTPCRHSGSYLSTPSLCRAATVSVHHGEPSPRSPSVSLSLSVCVSLSLSLSLSPLPCPEKHAHHFSFLLTGGSKDWDNSTCNYLPQGAVSSNLAVYPDCDENSELFWNPSQTKRLVECDTGSWYSLALPHWLPP